MTALGAAGFWSYVHLDDDAEDAKVYEDAQDIEETRARLASIGFGVRQVDQPLTNEP